ILKDNYIDSYILSNGQFIVAEGKILSQNIIETKVIDDLYQFSKKHDVNICYYGNSLLAVEEEDELVEKTFNYFSIAEYEERASFFKNNEVIMLMLLTENKKLDEYFKKEFPELNFYRTSPYSIDAIPNTASKGHAIRQFEKHMGFENMDSYAFGDSPNDISMFQVSDYKISMSNASEELKNISDIVVDNSNDTGVANGLRYFQLI
ncbi:HAD-IIB family hydrolase, partial [Aerococcus tenax]|uniref:HAD-IIB family hydrolase n=2 Tax=Aerococcaceae TaxID=186827 RepID=UPI0017858EFD